MHICVCVFLSTLFERRVWGEGEEEDGGSRQPATLVSLLLSLK